MTVSTTARIVAEGEPRPLVGDLRATSGRDSTRAGRSRRDSPATGDCRTSSASSPTFDTPTNPPAGRWNVLPATSALTGDGPSAPTCRSKSSASFHIGTQKHRVPRLADVLLRDLQLDRLVRLLERAEQRRRRLAHLEVDRAVLDLDDHVVVELAVERRKLSYAARARSFFGLFQSMWWS